VTHSKRKRLLEEEQDEYMEELDQRSRAAEETRLRRELDPNSTVRIKEESELPRRKRPKVLRKTIEEVNGWQGPYLAVWEAYDLTAAAPEDAGVEDVPMPSQRSPDARAAAEDRDGEEEWDEAASISDADVE
jgi:hypothetical protein